MYFKHDYFLVRFDAGFFDSLPVSFSISASLFFPLASARFRRAVLGVGLASSFFSSSTFSTFFRAGVFVFFVFVFEAGPERKQTHYCLNARLGPRDFALHEGKWTSQKMLSRGYADDLEKNYA